jgi:phosphatidylglycerol:prolipoprotein diacylglycerol transferase
MRRVLFRCGSVSIYSYPAMLYVGIVAGVYAQLFAALSIRLNIARTLTATLVLLTTALVGARLLFVIQNWSSYRRHLRRMWRFSESGASMYGGFLLALPVSVPLLAILQIPFGAFWDVASFTMLTGMIVTRFGCLLNGCCAGRPTTYWFGLNLPDSEGVRRRRVPVQILEAAWGMVVLAGAVMLWRHLPFEGALILYTMGAYGAGRIVLESSRNKQNRVAGINLLRGISVTFVTVSLVAFAIAWWS